MHAGSQSQSLDEIGAKDFQGAAVVVQADTGDHTEEGVGDDGWNLPGQPVVLTIPPPATDNVEIRRQSKQARNVCRIVLKITVQCHYQATTRGSKSCRESRRLTEVGCKA